MKIAIMGTGKSLVPVMESIKNTAYISYFIDNASKKIGTEIYGKKIVSPYEIQLSKLDFVVIATVLFETAIEQLSYLGVEKEKIICFYGEEVQYQKYKELFNIEQWKYNALKIIMKTKIDRAEKKLRIEINNLQYEIADNLQKCVYQFPHITSVEETYQKILKDKVSISRYGDGEYEIIAGHTIFDFQEDNKELSKRLREILTSNMDNHIVALAEDFGCLDNYNKDIKYAIRSYMTEDKRRYLYTIIDMEKKYYNAYISRVYSIYHLADVEEARERFHKLMEIWKNRDVIFIEGDMTRLGVGNDLFKNVKSIQRIIGPNENAFSKYNEILEAAKKINHEKLILIALGPTATVLAYDLAKEGYWALDIGHLDLEYEWFLKGKGQTYIPKKYNNEVIGDTHVEMIEDTDYFNQIIEEIKN